MDEIKHFTDYPEDEQESYAKEVAEKFKSHGFEVKSVEPLDGFLASIIVSHILSILHLLVV